MPGVPETSPSMKMAPFCASSAIWRFLSGTGCEPSSTTTCPGRAEWISPHGPCTTSSSASVDGRHDSTISAWAPTSAAERAGTPPIFSKSASEERRKPTTRCPLLIRFSEIGMPILPTPTKPMVSMDVPLNSYSTPMRYVTAPSLGLSCHLDRLIGEIDGEAERALHDRPFLQLKSAQPVFEERVALGQRAGFGEALRPQHGEAMSARRPLAVGERPGGENKTALLEPDHVFQMRHQKRLELFRRHRRCRDQHIKLLAQHFAHQLGNALFKKHGSGPGPFPGFSSS